MEPSKTRDNARLWALLIGFMIGWTGPRILVHGIYLTIIAILVFFLAHVAMR